MAPVINNYPVYVEGMKKAIYDKLFFVDKIDPSMIVDFGCADGTLMKEMRPYFPDIPIFGVDNDETMRSENKDFDVAEELAQIKPFRGAAIVLSSVIHEIESYCNRDEIDKLWDLIKQFDYIVIRDMCLSKCVMSMERVDDKVVREIHEKFPIRAREFENLWGPIPAPWNYIHFLLKYRYIDNWEREVEENYLPWDVEHYLEMFPNPLYFEHYSLPFLVREWEKDLGTEVKIPTHMKMIIKT